MRWAKNSATRSTSVWTLLSDEEESYFFDGQHAGGSSVTVELRGNELVIRDGGSEHWKDLDDADVRSPVGSGPWTIAFADGSSVTTSGSEVARQLGAAQSGSNFVRRLEAKWHWALVAIVATIAAMWGLLTFGLPAAAKAIAFALPPNVSDTIRTESLELMDELLFEPSTLAAEDRARVETMFADIVASDPEYQQYELAFRSSNIGPNAFAIPGGIVLITDELIHLAAKDAEITAVLAHEVGHLSGRHSLRMVLQNSLGAVLLATVTGDLTSITAVSAAIPTVLLQAKYSRDFEREADQFAFDYLRSAGLPTDALAELLMRIEDDAGGQGMPEWFSTHPASSSRRASE